MYEFMILALGSLLYMSYSYIYDKVTAKSRKAKQEMVYEDKEIAAINAAKLEYGVQLARFVAVLKHVTTTETSIYRHEVPKGINWENISFMATNGIPELNGVCRGVNIRFRPTTGWATVSWLDGSLWRTVEFDLKDRLLAERFSELVELFTQKFNQNKARS